MPLLVDIVQQQSPATPGSQAVNFPALGSATPKAVLAINNGLATVGQTAQDGQYSVGMSTGPASQYCISYYSQNGVLQTQCRQSRRQDRFVESLQGSGFDIRGNVDSFVSGRINVDFTVTNQQAQVTYIAFAGDTLTNVGIAEWAHQASTGNDPNTPTLLGWQPDCAIILSNGNTAWNNTTVGDFSIAFVDGAATPNQYVLGISSRHNQGTSMERYFMASKAIQYRQAFNGAIQGEAQIDSWAAGGFNATWNVASVAGRVAIGLFFQGSESAVVAEDSRVDLGLVTTALGFSPVLGMHASSSATAVDEQANANTRMSVGGFDNISNAVHGVAGLAGQGTSSHSVATANDKSLYHWDGLTLAEIAEGSFSGTDAVADFTTADATVRKFVVFGMGDTGAPTTPVTATITAVANTQGDFTITPPEIPVTATITAVANTQGDLVISHPVAATVTAVANTQGAFTITPPSGVNATITALANTSGDFTISPPSGLTATLTAVADTQGDLVISHPVDVTMTAVADTTGFIPVGVFTPNPCRVCTPPKSNPTCISTEC